jgi:hypothetical protein
LSGVDKQGERDRSRSLPRIFTEEHGKDNGWEAGMLEMGRPGGIIVAEAFHPDGI